MRGNFTKAKAHEVGNGPAIVRAAAVLAGGTKALPAGCIAGSPEQEAVWDVLLNRTEHCIVEAVAGSGKTFTLVQYALREARRRVGLVAFNKHIADELKARVGGKYNVDCMTYHSLGFKTVRGAMRGQRCEVDQYKVHGLLDGFTLSGVAERDKRTVKYTVAGLVGHCKSAGLDAAGADAEALDKLVDRFDVDLGVHKELVYGLVPKVLRKCAAELATVDYDDMVWLPHVLGLKPPQWDVLCVDEYQDTGLTQQSLAIAAGKRLCAVGDPRQAIYAFRGADSRGFERLREKLGKSVITLPLTLTRRCPKSHVRLAQTIVPQIRALDNAPEGVVRVVVKVADAVKEMEPGDLVVCRVNAELVGVAYKLLKRGVKAVVRGRDIGVGLTKLVDQAQAQGAQNPAEVIKIAGDITGDQIRKFMAEPHGKGEARAANCQDRYECLVELAEQCKGVEELRGVITRLFEDGEVKGSVVLGTVHRTKGLEGKRVYVLRPDLIPHPMARKKEDQESERNLGYVACTRSAFNPKAHEIVRNAATGECKCGDSDSAPSHQVGGELVFVGGESLMFPLPNALETPATRAIEKVLDDENPYEFDEDGGDGGPPVDYTPPKPLSKSVQKRLEVMRKKHREAQEFVAVRDETTGKWSKEWI